MPFIGPKPADTVLDSSLIDDGTITTEKIADGTIALADLSASGTKNNTTFLRGDNTFQVVNTDLSADTSPQLGGNLDGNGNTIDLSANTTHLNLPRGTTAQQVSPSAANEGAIRYDTDDNVVYYSDGSAWVKVSSVQSTLTSVTGNLIAGSASTLTLAGTGFMTANLVVNFLQSSDSINVNVTVTPTSDTAATVSVPSSVYSNVTAGNVVTIKVTNSDGLSSGNQTITAGSLPTGGTISTSGNYRIHKFTSSGTFAVGTVNPTVDILLLAGGGGGGAGNSSSTHSAGGGGAGGMFTSTSQSTSANTNYTVTIGSGGAGNTNAGDQGANGGNTTFTGQTNSVGGGGGGTRNTGSGTAEHPGNDGGSGGGSCPELGTGQAGGSGTSGQGNNGGTADRNIGRAGAGGGGKGSVGGIGQNHTGGDGQSYNGGAGGSGATNDYTGSSVTYAAGGGGGAANIGGPHGTAGASGHPANGGAGGSGTGSAANGNAGNANTGQGGGGGASGHPNSAVATGGNGGSGILVVRYDTTTL